LGTGDVAVWAVPDHRSLVGRNAKRKQSRLEHGWVGLCEAHVQRGDARLKATIKPQLLHVPSIVHGSANNSV